MTHLLSQDVDMTNDGVSLTNIYRSPRNHVIRTQVWHPRSPVSPPAAAVGSVLDTKYKWRVLIDISPANWGTEARGAHQVPTAAGLIEAYGPVAEDVYERVWAMLNCLDSPIAGAVPVMGITVTGTDGVLVATYSSTERARRDVEVINEEQGSEVVTLAAPVPHDPPLAVIRAAITATRTGGQASTDGR